MSSTLAPSFILAALVLCTAGALKLRSPAGAVSALGALGLPEGTGLPPAWLVRGLAVGELLLGGACAVHPTRALAAALALLYALFAVVAAVLRRHRAQCGCFGLNDMPVSLAHVIASELLGTLAAVAVIAPPHGLAWVLARPAAQAAVLLIGIAGAVYATVLVYTRLPAAWNAWSIK
jgi:hypothetical protein